MLPQPPAGRAFDVIGIGATSVDYVYVLPAYPAPTASLAKMRISRHFVSCGGQMATALATCARMGLRSKFVGVTGTDDNAKQVRRELEGRSVDMTDVVIRDVPNQYAVILVDEKSGERIVLWDRDERLRLRDREVTQELMAAARVVHVDDVDIDGALRAAETARAAGTPVTSDIDRITHRTLDLVKAVTFPIFAEHVPTALTGITDPAGALRALRDIHDIHHGHDHDDVLCVTLGIHGAMALEGDHLHHALAFNVNAVDTTGAGDVFRGGFIFAYLRGFALPEALRFANAAAAVSCTRLGAMASVPSPDEVERLMAEAETVN
jgi:sugar/nucleoside kinase (ribokinase family)